MEELKYYKIFGYMTDWFYLYDSITFISLLSIFILISIGVTIYSIQYKKEVIVPKVKYKIFKFEWYGKYHEGSIKKDSLLVKGLSLTKLSGAYEFISVFESDKNKHILFNGSIDGIESKMNCNITNIKYNLDDNTIDVFMNIN